MHVLQVQVGDLAAVKKVLTMCHLRVCMLSNLEL